jgi:hypothetical protein
MYSYEKNYGTPFQLQTAKLLAGKTGYLENDGVKNHCLVVYAKDSDSDTHYILVVGGGTQPQYVTMKDIKNITLIKKTTKITCMLSTNKKICGIFVRQWNTSQSIYLTYSLAG